MTSAIHETKPTEENILIRPDFATDNTKCGSLNKAAENLIKRTQDEENKNVDQLQLKSLANPVNILVNLSNLLVNLYNLYFNNLVSVTNDNNKI